MHTLSTASLCHASIDNASFLYAGQYLYRVTILQLFLDSIKGKVVPKNTSTVLEKHWKWVVCTPRLQRLSRLV